MLQLPNNCRAGKFSVFPSNWESKQASIKVRWRVSYWFFDDNLQQKKKIVIKSNINFDTLSERQDAIRMNIQDERDLLLNKGYNYVTKVFTAPTDGDVTENSPLNHALDFALSSLRAEPNTIADVASCVRYIKAAAGSLQMESTPIGTVKRKHLRMILEKCGKMKEKWSNNTYNHYRKYLSLLFKELLQADSIDSNPVRDLSKAKNVRRIRTVLTYEERTKINDHLKSHYYRFWLFIQIFFHSGSRLVELLRLKRSDVDLRRQRFKIFVKKGTLSREEWRPIKNVSLQYWEETCKDAAPDDYIFSEGLRPGKKLIRREQVTRRWEEHVKKKLGIKADLYSLKHLNLDETAAALDIHDAQRMAGHSTPVVTMGIYAQGEKERQVERLKRVENSFS